MDLANPRAEHAHGFNWIALPIKNHIGRVEIDAEIWPPELLEQLKQHGRSFLARFQSQDNVPSMKKIGHLRQTRHQLGEVWIRFRMRHKTGMKRDEFYTHVP